MIGDEPNCIYCTHYIVGLGFKCEAFPDEIPIEILMGKNHTEPYPGDNGIRFEMLTKEQLAKRDDIESEDSK